MAYLMQTSLWTNPRIAPIFEFDDQIGIEDSARYISTLHKQIPRNVRVVSKHKKIPDVVSLTAWYLALSENAKTAFCKVADKGINCYPMKITNQNDERIAQSYYFLSLKTVLRAVKIEGPDLRVIEIDSYENVGTKARTLEFNREGSSIRVRSSVIAGHNIWRDDFEGLGMGYDIFISDSLQREIKKAKLTGVNFTELIEA